MWLFRKRTKQADTARPAFESILCIPGIWDSQEDFILALVSSSEGEYLAAGPMITNTKEKWHFGFELCEYDPRMRTSFEYAGKVTGVTEDFLSEIEQHKSVLYIKSVTGDLKKAERIARAGLAVLRAGGIGIKVETVGKGFMMQAWQENLQNFEPSNLIQLFVLDSINTEDGAVFSCGMQNLGFKDTIVSGEEFGYAAYLVSLFAYYQVVDGPIIRNNETFTPTVGSPVFKITDEPEQPYKGHEQFGNPYGMWRLKRL